MDKRWQQGSTNQASGTAGAITGDDQLGQLSVVSVSAGKSKRLSKTARRYHRQLSQELNGISHHVFSKGSWRQAQLRSHPTVQLSIAPDHSSQKVVPVTAIADSGAQSDVWSLKEYLKAGFVEADLQSVNMSLSAANKSPIRITGAFFARIQGTSQNGS